MQSYRLADGTAIDRARPLTFTFNGRRYQGFAGDTLASALLANGVRLVGRSFKYHRPRGILSAGVEEPNALVQLETGATTQPNVQATMLELYDGLNATSVNCWPSVEWDAASAFGFASALLPAGFYYKTFMWPVSLWPRYEKMIRDAAGLGKCPTVPDPDTYDHRHAHCDVLVVGGGPAGLAAALAAAESGARVILAEQHAVFGGQLLVNGGPDWGERVDGLDGAAWNARMVEGLTAFPEVTLLRRTTAYAYYDHNYIGLLERRHEGARKPNGAGKTDARERLWRVRAKQVVLATGAIERPIAFAENDLPGVMLASAVRKYVQRQGVVPGKRTVVFTNNDDAYRTVLALAEVGAEVAAVVDVRREIVSPLREAARQQGIDVLEGWAVVRAAGGKHGVGSVTAMALDETGRPHGSARRIACDCVAVSGGWNPAIHLFSQSGGKAAWDETQNCFVPGRSVQAEHTAGACRGRFALADVLADGTAAGLAAAALTGHPTPNARSAPAAETFEETPAQPYWIVPEPVGTKAGDGRFKKRFLDLHNDVTVADIELAAREGYDSSEHAKRYTTLGMGTDQGKTGNIHGLKVLADVRNATIPQVGTTTFRPPYTPVTLGAFAGRNVGAFFDPIRRTPMHDWHLAAGCTFEAVGQWHRPWYFPKDGETMRQAVDRECLAARTGVGILDASTLGKIDIQGPDARTLLNWVYTNAWTKLAVGRCRYGLMCTEDGMVFDDGVTARLGEQHYWMSTTSGNAARVLGWLEEWLQTEWPHLRVFCNSVTESWATASICGPSARTLLARLTDLDVSTEAFPHMTWRAATVAGIPARIFRVSFTGEVSYEITVPARYGLSLWTTLMETGADLGITPFGTETMHVLRAEKGFIIAGQETDGAVTPLDLGMDWAISKQKDFLGKRSLKRSDTARDDRKQLVGLLTADPAHVLPEGGQIVADRPERFPAPMLGHVTSSYYSANLGRSIALALVKDGRRRQGQTVYAGTAEQIVPAVIADTRFFDPDGSRMHA